MLETPEASCGTSIVTPERQRSDDGGGDNPTGGDPSDHAGQSAGKAGRLPSGIRRRGRKLPRRDPTEPVHKVRLATRTPSSTSARTPSELRSSSSCEPDSAAAGSGPTPGPVVGTGRSSTWYGTATIF